MSKRLFKIIEALIVSAGSLAVALALWTTGVLGGFEGVTWNVRETVMADKAAANESIVLILLDQYSLDWARDENGLSWPWPREAYALVASFCKRADARALAFDIVFTEPSLYGVDDDQTFGNALGTFGRCVGTVFLGNDKGKFDSWPSYYPDSRTTIDFLDDWMKSHDAVGISTTKATFPIEDLAPRYAYLANVEQKADPDGVYREVNYFFTFDGQTVPSMALAMYLAGGAENATLAFDGDRLAVDARPCPVTHDGKAILRFRGPSGTHRTYNAASIIQSELRLREGGEPVVSPSELAGCYVFFGFSAPGLYDLRPSPVDASYPGVEIHATLLDNILSGDMISDIPIPIMIGAIVLITLISAIVALYAASAFRTVIVYTFALLFPLAAGVVAYRFGYRVPIIPAEVAVVLALVGAGTINYATEGRQKKFIKGAFSQYLSPAVIEQLLADPEKLKLGGERRELSIFFSDIQGFTTVSERLDPESLTAFLNDYLSAMTDIIMEEGGTVDKYEGDAIIAFWNAPLDLADHSARAVRSALRCQRRLAELRPSLRERTGADVFMRIGLNTGYAVVGNMGSKSRFDYTMLGDSVNLAARLEGINKQFGTYTMVSGAIRDKAGNSFAYRELSRVVVVGRKEPVVVYEPMFHDEYATKKEIAEVFENGLKEYYAGNFKKAIDVFRTIEDRDPPASAYIKKCGELGNVLPADWNGVWVMTSK